MTRCFNQLFHGNEKKKNVKVKHAFVNFWTMFLYHNHQQENNFSFLFIFTSTYIYIDVKTIILHTKFIVTVTTHVS